MFLLSQILLSARNEIIALTPCYLESLGFPPPKQFYCPPLTHRLPRCQDSIVRLTDAKNEPIRRLKNISKVLFKEPLQARAGSLRWGNRALIENPLGTLRSEACALCDWFVWGRLMKLGSLAFATTSRPFPGLNVPVCSTQASSLDSSPGKLFALPSDAVSQDFSQGRSSFPWTQDIILWKIYCPQQKVASLVLRKRYCESHVAHSYLSELTSDEWVNVHILVTPRRCALWIKSHCVLHAYLALCVDLLWRKNRATIELHS